MRKITKILRISIIKTIRFNFHYFGIKGVIKTPVLIAKNIKIKALKGKCHIQSFKRGSIRIGIYDCNFYEKRANRGIWQNYGEVYFGSGIEIYLGAKIYNKGLLKFGNGFRAAQMQISCNKHIEFGNNTIVSWDTLFLDSDYHKIYNLNEEVPFNVDKSIIIGDNVWIGCRCTILKGAKLANNTILAANSLLSKEIKTENCIVSNNNIIKTGIRWEI